ncbi:MAG: SOS response-associated peptidase [Clostridia bacterium]|nr:SOS response-associated peptidase [Clostridia bacterium]
MCGRYVTEEDTSIDMKRLYDHLRAAYPAVSLKSGEIFPTETVPILCGAGNRPIPGKWGFQGFNHKGVIINARAETVMEKPFFRDCFLNRRCIIPTNGYYEWSKSKEKYRFNLPDSPLSCLAGLYRNDPDGARFVILTTSANESVTPVHHRMPLVLTPSMTELWTSHTKDAIAYLSAEMPELIKSVL